eukprot:s97_g34.t1
MKDDLILVNSFHSAEAFWCAAKAAAAATRAKSADLPRHLELLKTSAEAWRPRPSRSSKKELELLRYVLLSATPGVRSFAFGQSCLYPRVWEVPAIEKPCAVLAAREEVICRTRMLSFRSKGAPRRGREAAPAQDADTAMATEDAQMGPSEQLMEEDEDVAFEALLEKRVHQEYDKDFGDDFDDDDV